MYFSVFKIALSIFEIWIWLSNTEIITSYNWIVFGIGIFPHLLHLLQISNVICGYLKLNTHELQM